MHTMTMSKVINANINDVFEFWVRAGLLEKWAFPDGMTLVVPYFEARPGGDYRFEHTGAGGRYACTGYLEEYVPNQRLVMIDHVIRNEDEELFPELQCEVEFAPLGAGTRILIVQTGFADATSMQECEVGWTQSLRRLAEKLEGIVHAASDRADARYRDSAAP